MQIGGYQGKSLFASSSNQDGKFKTFTISATALYIKGHHSLEEAKKYAASMLGKFYDPSVTFSGKVEKIVTVLVMHEGLIVAKGEVQSKQPDISQ